MEIEEKTRFCLIRHGETDWNAQLRIQGHRDMPLNANGLAQAEAVGQALSGQHFDTIVSSDLLRARQTAQPLLAARGLLLQLEPGLRERNFGCCEGMTISEIEAESPQIAAAMAARHPDYVLPEGESLQQLFDRVIRSVAALAQRCAGQCVAVVAHGGVLEMIYRRVHGIALQPPRSFALPNASINWLAISGEQWVFESWAETAHLGDIPIAPVVTRI